MSTYGAPVLVARDLVKIYGSGNSAITALNDVNLSVERGQFTAIMGPSGSGKSTLMHCLAGLDSITSGSVVLDGEDLSSLSERKLTRLRRNKIGFIFQSFNLVPTLTAKENILLPRGIARRKVSHERFEQVVEAVGLADRLEYFPVQLSGGQQQRVACARALVGSPAVVFADEPTGNLDSQSTYQVLQFLRQAVDSFGQTVVMVTHEADAAAWADRVVFIHDGKIAHELVNPTRDTVLDALRLLGDTSDLGAAARTVTEVKLPESVSTENSYENNHFAGDFHSAEFAESEFMGIVTGEIEMVDSTLSASENAGVNTAGTDFTRVRDALKGKAMPEDEDDFSTDISGAEGASGLSDLFGRSASSSGDAPADMSAHGSAISGESSSLTPTSGVAATSTFSDAPVAPTRVSASSRFSGGTAVAAGLSESGSATLGPPPNDILAKRGYADLAPQINAAPTPRIDPNGQNGGLSEQNLQITSLFPEIKQETLPAYLPQEQREIIDRAQEILEQLPGSVMDEGGSPKWGTETK